MNTKQLEKISKALFFISSLVSIGAVLLICIFIFSGAAPALGKIGIFKFLLGTQWKPNNDPQKFGIFYMIIGSIYVSAGAIVMGVPIGILSAVFLAKFCPKKLYVLLSQAVSLLAGIPSIVYGFFGMMLIVPFIAEHFSGNGNSLLAASVVLAIMILPTVITISENSLRALPSSYYEGAVALGATKEEAVFKVMLPAAKSGIVTSVVLGIGRAIGETIAVGMVAGNSNILPVSIFKSVRTLTVNIVSEMGYASDLHYDALIATGAVLFVFILLLNMLLGVLTKGGTKA
ncbi:MAG: phosphate ABC transporter permease subunit PstC [Clostridia bacterium]|nr:phosphate ABC transporter permease subunit PstC [Clostridia bacterium]